MPKRLILSSALILGAAHCGGGSTPPSQAPSGTPTDPSVQGGSGMTGSSTSSTSEGPGTTPSSSGTTTSALGGSAEGAAAAAAPLSDSQIAAVTAGVNDAEIQQAQLAQSKAQSEQVRRFAAMMIEHHTQARQKQQALQLGSAESPLSQQMGLQSRLTLESLEAKQGAEFDRAYMQAQVEGHQRALEAIRQQLKPAAQNPELRTYLQELEPQVAEHLTRAQAAQQSLQSGTTNVQSSKAASSR